MWVGSIFEEQFEFFQTLLQSLKAGLWSGNASITSLCLAFLEEVSKERPCVQLFLFHMLLFTFSSCHCQVLVLEALLQSYLKLC